MEKGSKSPEQLSEMMHTFQHKGFNLVLSLRGPRKRHKVKHNFS